MFTLIFLGNPAQVFCNPVSVKLCRIYFKRHVYLHRELHKKAEDISDLRLLLSNKRTLLHNSFKQQQKSNLRANHYYSSQKTIKIQHLKQKNLLITFVYLDPYKHIEMLTQSF